MNYNYQFGTLQMILTGIAFVSVCIFMHSLKRWKLSDGLLALLVSVLVLSLLYCSLMTQAYIGATSDVLVARVHASAFTNVANQMSVEITLYDQDGKTTSDTTYALKGNEWTLHADVIKVSGLLTLMGLHSGYKLTRLEGRYDDPNLERNAAHTVIDLNGGDDGFFQTARWLSSVVSPFVDATYGNALIDGPGTFNVYVSQSGLWAKGV